MNVIPSYLIRPFFRFEVVRVRRGQVMECYRPLRDPSVRAQTRAMLADMKEDARRWGDVVQVRRVRSN